VLNAANEVAVEAFLKGNISFVSIPDIIREALDVSDIVALNHIDDVLVADQAARRAAASALTQLS
jgi:1-deoxy-D-xylulose-5-phosphate reductoisomerase